VTRRYLGQLASGDPLDGYLRFDIAPQLGFSGTPAGFNVYQFIYSRDVYMYEEINRAFSVVGKFYPPGRRLATGMVRPPTETEFQNLTYLHNQGLNSSTFKIARPLGYNPWLDNLLVVEYLKGELLGEILEQVVTNNKKERLFKKLSALAEFMACLHNRTAGEWTVDFRNSYDYTGRLIESLVLKHGMDRSKADELYPLRENWRNRAFMWEDRRVIVHGDATPSNFKFGSGRQVLIFDLERMMWADRVFDLGRLSGELKHFFMQTTGDRWAAEPFISHFIREYCIYFPDRDSAFRSITRRLPFYIGITLLRIARNNWIDSNYRRKLIDEAKENLRADI
jgi:thiamine kinase-like enzyme